MSKLEKMIRRIKQKPADYTFDEMSSLLCTLGFEIDNKGKSSGSRIMFEKDRICIYLHKPHPHKEIKKYQLKQVLDILEREGLI